MSRNNINYEVMVEVEKPGSERYEVVPYLKGMFVKDKIVKMFHKRARTPEQAAKKCIKYGRVIRIRKTQVDRMLGNPEKLLLPQEPLGVYTLGSPYKNAVAMDEMIWDKQNKKRKNKHRDKISVNDTGELDEGT